VIISANTTEKRSSDESGEIIPTSAPTAMPVKAPWPKESEKNAIRLETTIVLRSPKSGVISSTADYADLMESLLRELMEKLQQAQ